MDRLQTGSQRNPALVQPDGRGPGTREALVAFSGTDVVRDALLSVSSCNRLRCDGKSLRSEPDRQSCRDLNRSPMESPRECGGKLE